MTPNEKSDRISVWLKTTGGVVAVLLLVQFLTGVLLAFYYVPSVDHAHTTVSYIEKVVSSGSWLRSLHHYGSQWVALFAFLHVVRLFWDRAYVDRRVQWIAAVLLLMLVMAGAGTGYSLPWDARAFFSTRVAEGLVSGLPFAGRIGRLWVLGGSDISTITLSRFFALHVLVTPFAIMGVVWWKCRRVACWSNVNRSAIVGGVVFVALAVWCLKYPAPFGPPVETMTADYLPRPGTQFLWLYQSLKYVPGGLGSIVGVVLPGLALLVLVSLPWLGRARLIGGVLLACFTLSVTIMTLAAYLSDRATGTREQLAKQAAQETAWRNEPFTAKVLQSASQPSQTSASGGVPVMYVKFCANCHGARGEGGQQGPLRFPPLLDVAAKPRRTVDDIVGLLKDPAAYGLQPPMRSFSDKLTEQEMKEIAAFVVQLKK
ncbi:MAG TPA: cytochrome b N-terminal domain-containing protein [Pyrinomonadaceae bacterium]|jgi:ubiquinol-cytochrome c reductase cytochrome b subunit|nr:cytochrome b N-terminal domain-containing protein [Pyrinomonadaceae bacterium]